MFRKTKAKNQKSTGNKDAVVGMAKSGLRHKHKVPLRFILALVIVVILAAAVWGYLIYQRKQKLKPHADQSFKTTSTPKSSSSVKEEIKKADTQGPPTLNGVQPISSK